MDDCMNKEFENQKSSRRNRAVEVELDGPELSYDSGDGDRALVVMESSVVKKRKKKRNCTNNVKEKEESGECGVRDPLVVFGSDIMMMILSCLDARSVALPLLVSRGWHGVASSDTLWAPKCKELWLGKAHLPRLSQVEGLSRLAAYSLSVMDGKRTRIMREDLWDHVWEFHFNKVLGRVKEVLGRARPSRKFLQSGPICSAESYEVAPEYWRNLDPYWKGTRPLMHRYFHPDGSQTADPGDKVWDGYEACYSIVTSFLADGKIREHYVRINRWPRLVITRKEDWSWEMSNNIYSYSSVPDAESKGGTGPYFTAY